MKAVIVEDEIIVADHLKTILESNKIDVVGMCENLEEAENSLLQKPDFYLLDIRLSHGHNGIDFGMKLKQLGIPFVYITANNEVEVMKEAIKTNPENYITKPFRKADVLAGLEFVKLKIEKNHFIEIITSKGTEKLMESDILYCQADGVYTNIFTSNRGVVTQRINLKDLEEKLSDQFIRIHRSFVVNEDKITAKKANKVFIDDMEFPVSRSYKSVLK
ncbi:response regulator transcription factor [Paracrocinitomix mangrovi]|uniref:LytR/AlgR family response regulator transcription factor n=1 Tax=Paracrocinitomix mangrovi TaxID=2862509 RepID=UPI001C8DACEC|nr:response regulator transcription factor [Paracrocinitomix mangrovi]UKN00984.1 response regulator transcription factor [Paracrocinitomix mangrovi]